MPRNRDWYKLHVGDTELFVDCSESTLPTGRSGLGHICFIVDGIIPQQEMRVLSTIAGYGQEHGPIHGVNRGKTESGKEYTFWKLYASEQ